MEMLDSMDMIRCVDWCFLNDCCGAGFLLKYAATTVNDTLSLHDALPISEQAGNGYEVAWKLGGADQYVIWNTDSFGNEISGYDGLSAGSFSIQSLESSFHHCLNGNRVTGAMTTVIEALGSTHLTQVADRF